MNIIQKNMVLQDITKDEEIKRIRVIWLDTLQKFAFIVQLKGEGTMPIPVDIYELEMELEVGTLVRVDDPYLKIYDEDTIPENLRQLRDNAWLVVEFLWNEEEPEILFKRHRSQCIKAASEKFGIPEYSVKRIMKRFWQRGMTKNALLPNYVNSGGPGKKRNATQKKRGRPRKSGRDGEVEKGINITEDVQRIFSISIEFYRNKKKPSLMQIYNKMLRKFYADSYKEGDKERVKIWDKSRIPTYHQFYYWYKKEFDFKKDYINRNSENAFNLKHRELLGSTNIEVFGPGSRYQIDATVVDIYIVSSINRTKKIGRPVVYGVIDVYSRMIVGVYAGLEGPSWVGAMMALDNVVADKVEFCKQYGIEITEEDWPNAYLPEILIADRGEFEGYNVENLINNLNVTVENTPPYRGDLKSIIERYFRTINDRIKQMAPGAIEKEYRERGDRDYRLDASLTLQEFIEVFVSLVIVHNKKVMEKYPMEKEMIVDEVEPRPVDIWKWGVKNRKGAFKNYPRDVIRLNLLPKAKANISRQGMKFNKMFYSTEQAIKEQWFINRKREYVDIVYDPRNVNYIYIPAENGRDFIKCFLLEKSYTYKDMYLEEVIYLEELKAEIINEATNDNNQTIADININIETIIKDAVKRTDQEKDKDISKRQQVINIKKHRMEERMINREKEQFELDKKIKQKEEVLEIDNETINQARHESVDTSKSTLELLRKKRDEKLGKE